MNERISQSGEGSGMEAESDKNNLVFYQTRGGAYDSVPNIKDVLNELGLGDEEENDWRRQSYDMGHGEYRDNVDRLVNYCVSHDIKDPKEIESLIKSVEIEEV